VDAAARGWPPLLIHLRVDGQPYGRPIHAKAFGPQDAITKISATNLSTVDAQGFPTRYALLDPMAEIDDDLDDEFGTDGPTINVSPTSRPRPPARAHGCASSPAPSTSCAA
jgi:hypothetical protein